MTDLLYPELPRGAAHERLSQLRLAASKDGVHGLRRLASLRHPRAYWPPTGGRAAQESDLYALATTVEQSVENWRVQAKAGEAGNRDFDLLLGKVLHRSLGSSSSGASREGMWSFLTLMVFPEYLYARFPSMPDERAFGKQRNVLRRVWLREDVLGEVIHDQPDQLREDEFVQIMERTALIRTPSLARAVAKQVLSRPADAQREAFTRSLAKEVVRRTGPLLLDALSPDELESLVEECAARH